MRITNASMVRSHLYDTQNNLTNMSKINQQISTGKVINTVSDDPHKAIKIMNINNEIKYTEKYNYNIDETVGWMNTTDGALDNVGNLLGEIKETIEAKVENGYIVFETSHLSHYGIVAIEDNNNNNNNIVNPKTNDDIVMYFISSIISLVGVTGVLIYHRKNKTN